VSMSRPLPVIMAVVVFVMLLSCTVPPPKVSEISCQGVARHWIGEVAPNSDGLATEVLEISNLQESSRVVNEFKNSLECTGDAKFANQTWYNVVVGYFKDADGEHWYEIQAVGKIPEPTTPKTLENPDSTKASRATPARQSTPQPTPQPTQTPDSFPSLECSDLSPRVIDEAKYFPDPFLELLMAEKISHDDAKIICRGVVKTESGLESPISFYATNYEGFGIDELSLSDYSCEYLAVQAINVSESIEYDPKLLKIFDSEESSRVANQFQNSLGCTGKVKTTDGTYTITFSGRIDGDG
jgi:hypothetical protein